MTLTDAVIWLQERTALGVLSGAVLNAIALVLEEQLVAPQTNLVVDDTTPQGLYILKHGHLESQRTNQTSGWAIGLLPGAIINLQELLLNQPTQRTIVTTSESCLWFIPADRFRELVSQYPEISQFLSQQLAQELAQLSSQLSYEQERQAALLPYLVTRAKRGIVGKSRYAVRLRQQIKQACSDRKPAVIFGEPGLEKDNIAALLHFGSTQRREPIIKLDCSKLQASGSELFGR